MPDENTVSTIALNDGAVTIKWTDGTVTTVSAKYLRVNCACAECVEEWTNRKLLDPATVSANIQAEDYLMVGKYAVQFPLERRPLHRHLPVRHAPVPRGPSVGIRLDALPSASHASRPPRAAPGAHSVSRR